MLKNYRQNVKKIKKAPPGKVGPAKAEKPFVSTADMHGAESTSRGENPATFVKLGLFRQRQRPAVFTHGTVSVKNRPLVDH